MVEKLALTNTEFDLISDFDVTAVYKGTDNEYHTVTKDDCLFEAYGNGNLSGLRLYFTKNPALLKDETVKIMFRSNTQSDTLTGYSYLVLAKPSDSLEILFDKLRAVNFDENQAESFPLDFKDKLLKSMIVSTKATLDSEEYSKL